MARLMGLACSFKKNGKKTIEASQPIGQRNGPARGEISAKFSMYFHSRKRSPLDHYPKLAKALGSSSGVAVLFSPAVRAL
jgi:hypothetical protein